MNTKVDHDQQSGAREMADASAHLPSGIQIIDSADTPIDTAVAVVPASNVPAPEAPGANAAYVEARDRRDHEPDSIRHRLHLWLRDLAISVFASLLIITFLYQPVKVEGTSMQPELRDQDRLFINKFVYHFEHIERGDVVVFHYPRDPAKSYIKRVVGLPGDSLSIERGRVFVNGHELDEPYVPRRYHDARTVDEIVVPPGEYWVMGDHRSISSDSRDFGPVDRSLIYGKAAFVYWPTAKMRLVR